MSSNCIICGTKLISAAELVRSSVTLHLEAKFRDRSDPIENKCFSCFEKSFLEKQCLNCHNLFCKKCCEFIKDDIRFCIGCFEK